MNRLYILPTTIGTTGISEGTRIPKYIADIVGLKWGAMYYGTESVCMVMARDITATQHDNLVANSDVMSIPENLDVNMTTGQVNAAQSFLENLNVPAGWIDTSRTVRQVVKVIGGIFQFNQRWSGLSGGSSPFKENMDLSKQYATMNTAAKSRVQSVMSTMQVDTSGLTGNSTIREILQNFGQTLATRRLLIGGVDI